MSSAGKTQKFHPADLATFHKNPRVGDVGAIAASLQANGQYRPIVVNKGTHTGRPNEVLAGNHTLMAIRTLAEDDAKDTRWHNVETWLIDVDDDRANRIVLADNKTSELGYLDDSLVLPLLEGMDTLDGTAFSAEELDRMMRSHGGLGDDSTGFLDDFLNEDGSEDDDSEREPGDPEAEDGEPADTGDQYITMSWTVTVEQRSQIRRVLHAVQTEHELATSAAALLHLVAAHEGVSA